MSEPLCAQQLVDFWFGELTSQGLCDNARRRRFFRASKRFDAELHGRFADQVEQAQAGRLNSWRTETRGWQALLLLLDQLPRNLYRGTPRAFAGDSYALTIAREGVSRGDDRLLSLEPRIFSYLPFSHSESLANQQTCVQLLRNLQNRFQGAPGPLRVIAQYLHHANAHCRIIETFGRFPHRNTILGRISSEAEQAWLARDGRRFGQYAPDST